MTCTFLWMILCYLYRIKPKTYMFFLSLLFAIEEINRNAHILPNITLGFDVYNIPFIDADTMYVFLKWISGIDNMIPNYNCKKESKSVALITGPSWTVSTLIGELLEMYKFPQVSIVAMEWNELIICSVIMTYSWVKWKVETGFMH